jgi:hypothetical protein
MCMFCRSLFVLLAIVHLQSVCISSTSYKDLFHSGDDISMSITYNIEDFFLFAFLRFILSANNGDAHIF